MYKKIMSVTLLLIICIIFVSGCGQKDLSVSSIVQKGVLTVGVPDVDTNMFYLDKETNEYRGIEAEIVDIIAHGINLPVEYVRMDKDAFLTNLSTGSVDLIIGSLCGSDSIYSTYYSSKSYADSELYIVTPRGLGVGDLSIFMNKNIGISSKINSMSYSDLLYVSGIVPYSFESSDAALVSLGKNDISGYLCFKEDAEKMIDSNSNYQMQNAIGLSNEKYNIIMMPNGNQLLNGVNQCISDYLSGDKRPSWIVEAEEKEKSEKEKIENQ